MIRIRLQTRAKLIIRCDTGIVKIRTVRRVVRGAKEVLTRRIPAENNYRMAGNFGGKIFWWIAEIMTFGGIYFGD